MKNFTIENETNNITIHGSVKEAEAVPNSERFSNEAALAKLAANWPASRLVEIWNTCRAERRSASSKDRATAVSRIWKAIQNLGQVGSATEEPAPVPEAPPVPAREASETAQPEAVIPASTEPAPAATVAPQSLDVAPAEPGAKKKATRAKKAPVAAAAKEAGAPREGSKTSQAIAMLQREGGTTLEEIMTAMGWLKHTTRAMLSAGLPDKEARAGRHQRKGWRKARLLDQSVNHTGLVLFRRRIQPRRLFFVPCEDRA
jgi:hypothetical protein